MPSYLTTADVAQRLGVSLDTVRRWLRSGELKGATFGRAGYRIENEDFQAFLHQRQRHVPEFSFSPPESSNGPSKPVVVIEEVLNMMGQELRRPLITTQGLLQQARRLLQQTVEIPLSDNTYTILGKLQDMLERVERQINKEMGLVGDILEASRAETNTLELAFTWCNLVEIVREVVTSQQDLAPQRSFELELPDDDIVAVIVDQDRIRQALTHYLTNALKFSPVDQPIKVSLHVRNGLARVSVQDRGPGIPASEQERIWDRFYQASKQPAESRGGLGLGLYLTRAIIQKHRGQVGVESHEEAGSTFWCTLPLADDIWH